MAVAEEINGDLVINDGYLSIEGSLGYLNMNLKEIKWQLFQNLSNTEINALTPISSYRGMPVFNTTLAKFGVCNGTTWIYPGDMNMATYDSDGDGIINLLSIPAHSATHKSGGSDEIPLNQLAVPTANVDLNGKRIIQLANAVADTDAVTYGQAKAMSAGTIWKEKVKVIITASTTLSGLLTIDGYQTVAGDRVLRNSTTTPSANGIYIAGTGIWARASDADSWDKLVSARVIVERGTQYKDTEWLCTIDTGAGTLGTTSILWIDRSSSTDITAGTGLSKSGNQMNVEVDGITIGVNGSNKLEVINPSGTSSLKNYFGTIPANATAGSNNSILHGMGVTPRIVEFRNLYSRADVKPVITVCNSTSIQFNFSIAIPADTYSISLIGWE